MSQFHLRTRSSTPMPYLSLAEPACLDCHTGTVLRAEKRPKEDRSHVRRPVCLSTCRLKASDLLMSACQHTMTTPLQVSVVRSRPDINGRRDGTSRNVDRVNSQSGPGWSGHSESLTVFLHKPLQTRGFSGSMGSSNQQESPPIF